MRSLSCLAIAVAALSIACGGPAPEGGNVYVTESALEGVDGAATPGTPVRIVPVQVDADDPGCTVDGSRYDRCTLTLTPTGADYQGPQNLCELSAGATTFVSDCDIGDDVAGGFERLKEVPWHCPGEH